MNENQTEDISYRVAKHHSLRKNKGGRGGGGGLRNRPIKRSFFIKGVRVSLNVLHFWATIICDLKMKSLNLIISLLDKSVHLFTSAFTVNATEIMTLSEQNNEGSSAESSSVSSRVKASPQSLSC